MMKFLGVLVLVLLCAGCQTTRDVSFDGTMAQRPDGPQRMNIREIAFGGSDLEFYQVKLAEHGQIFTLNLQSFSKAETAVEVTHADFSDAYFMAGPGEEHQPLHGTVTVRRTKVGGPVAEIRFDVANATTHVTGAYQWKDRMELNESVAGLLFGWMEVFQSNK